METHLTNKFLHAHQKVMWLCAMRRDNLTGQRTDLFHSIYKLLWSFWNAWAKSVIKVFLYNCLKRLFSNSRHPPPSLTHLLCYICFLWGANNFINENYYIQWLLIYFLWYFSLPGSDDFVLFDSLDGNGALFAYVLCDIPVLRIS